MNILRITWFTDVGNKSKLTIYSTFKSEFEAERYLNCKIIKTHREALSKLRYSSHMLQIGAGRQKNFSFSEKNISF